MVLLGERGGLRDSVLVSTEQCEALEMTRGGREGRWPLDLISVACGAMRRRVRGGEECGVGWGCSWGPFICWRQGGRR
jgi:hypothetical protein